MLLYFLCTSKFNELLRFSTSAQVKHTFSYQVLIILTIASLKNLTIATAIAEIFCLALDKILCNFYEKIYLT